MVENPANLGGGEVGVDGQAGLLGEFRFQPASLQRIAEMSGAPALPDDSVADRLSGGALPDYCGFPLVRNAYGVNLARAYLSGFQQVVNGLDNGVENLVGVVLDPAGLWIYLGDFLVCLPDDAP